MKLNDLFIGIVICAFMAFAGPTFAGEYMFDSEIALKNQLQQAEIAKARLEGATEADKAKIALLEKEKVEAHNRARLADNRAHNAEHKATRAQRAANAANYRLAVMKAKNSKSAKTKKSKASKPKANS